MSRLIAGLSCFFVLTGCEREPPSASRPHEVATNLLDGNSWSPENVLFFPEGAMITRATCDSGAVVFDRVHCTRDLQSVPAVELQTAVYGMFGQDMDIRQREAADHQVAIDRADRRLMDLVDIDPEPEDPELRPEIDAKSRELIALDGEVAALDDQITRLERALALQEDADRRTEMREYQVTRAVRVGARTTVAQELNALRQRFVEANSSVIDPLVYQAIQDQRRLHATALVETKRRLDVEVARRIAAAQLLNLIADQGFTYEYMRDSARNGVKEVAYEIRGAFDAAYRRYSEFGVVPDRYYARINVTRHGPIERFRCDISWNASCNRVKITRPDQSEIVLNSTSFDVSATRSTNPLLSPLIGADGFGSWTIVPYCSSTASTITSHDCKVILR